MNGRKFLAIGLLIGMLLPLAIGATWVYPDTYRQKYLLLRGREVGEDASTIDLTTAGDFASRPSGAVQIASAGHQAGYGSALEVIFCGGAAADKTFSWRIYMWRKENGPCEYVAHGTGIFGTQAVVLYPDIGTAATGKTWADTLVITGQSWRKTASVIDSGNNRITKLIFDFCGFDYIYAEITDADGLTGTEADNVTAYYSWFN